MTDGNKSIWNEERGQFSYAIVFIMIFILLLITFVIVIPFLNTYTVSFYAGMEPAVTQATALAGTIQDANVRTAFQGALQSQTDTVTTNVQILSALATYAGIIILIIVLLVLYLMGRRNVQIGVIG